MPAVKILRKAQFQFQWVRDKGANKLVKPQLWGENEHR